MKYWIEAESAGHYFFSAFPFVLVLLFVLMKESRVRFLIPSVIIAVIIVNPWFYKFWDKLGLYAYWRILWIVPVIPVIAGLTPTLNEKVGILAAQKYVISGISKVLITVIGIIGIVQGGSFVYNTARGQFEVATANNSKLPSFVVEIADRLLELKEHPRIIAQDPIGVYIRQYTGEIDTLFGRDMDGHINYPSRTAREINGIINDSEMDMEYVSQFMLDDNYDFLVVAGERHGKGLHMVDTINGYSIYEAEGVPTIIKSRNELGQVVTITSIDDKGEPINNIQGYATTTYTYDDRGFIASQFYSTSEDIGIGGQEMERDSAGRITMRRNLNSKREPYIQEGGFYGYSQIYNSKEEIILREYIDLYGNQIQRTDGYSKVVWETNKDNTRCILFFDIEGNEVPIDGLNLVTDIQSCCNGWSEWIEPTYNTTNSCISIGSFNLGDKHEGEKFTCQIEIEFKDVQVTEGQDFYFRTQGHADGSWYIGNIWTSNLVFMTEPPRDGIYRYIATNTVNEEMVSVSTFDIGFRCDNWSTGVFRFRNIKIEKGDIASSWTPGV